MNYKEAVIRIECTGSDILPLDAIEEFQGNLKKRSKREIDLIIKSIEKYGFSFPFFIWNGDGHNRCLDGHGRIQALSEMRRRGYSLPLFPVSYVEAKDEEEAKQKLLRLNSQYGIMTIDSVLEFTDGITVEWDELALPKDIFKFDKNEKEDDDKEFKYKEKLEIIVNVKNKSEAEVEELYNELTERGFQCRISTL